MSCLNQDIILRDYISPYIAADEQAFDIIYMVSLLLHGFSRRLRCIPVTFTRRECDVLWWR